METGIVVWIKKNDYNVTRFIRLKILGLSLRYTHKISHMYLQDASTSKLHNTELQTAILLFTATRMGFLYVLTYNPSPNVWM